MRLFFVPYLATRDIVRIFTYYKEIKIKVMKAIINFYEGSYQYSTKELSESSVRDLAQLGAGVLLELNHQHNYRPTKESLWAEITLRVDNVIVERYRVTRLKSVDYKLVDVLDGMKEIILPTPIFISGLTFINQ